MNETEVRALLAAAVAYDNRRPSQSNIAAWLEAANRGDWTFAEALDAIHEHNTENPDFLKPAHVTQRIRAKRDAEKPAWPPPYAALPATQPADETTRRRVMAMVGDRFRLRARRERRPAPRSADHVRARAEAEAALEAKRAELDALLPDGDP